MWSQQKIEQSNFQWELNTLEKLIPGVSQYLRFREVEICRRSPASHSFQWLWHGRWLSLETTELPDFAQDERLFTQGSICCSDYRVSTGWKTKGELHCLATRVHSFLSWIDGRWMWRSRTSVPKDYSATGSYTGRTTPELLLKLWGVGVSYSVQRSDLLFIFLFWVWYHITFGTLTPV